MENISSVKRRLITSMISLLLLVITIFGITYAYFTLRIKGNTNTKSTEVTAGKLELTYDDGNGLIELLKIQPGTTLEPKVFTVKNTGTNKIDSYDVIVEDVINELYRNYDLTYKLTCTSDKKTCSGANDIFPSANQVLVSNSIDVGETQTYKITLVYKETNVDQSVDMNKSVTAKINIVDNDIYNAYNNILIYGNSEQNGVPSPETPVDIESVGDLITDVNDLNYGKYYIPLTLDGENVVIYLNEPLRKIGNYVDYLNIKSQKVIRYVGKKVYVDVYNETERYENYSRYGLGVFNPSGIWSTHTEKSNYFSYSINGGPNSFYVGGNAAASIFVNDSLLNIGNQDDTQEKRISKVDNWLRNLEPPLEILYPLASPIEETIDINIAKKNYTNVVVNTTIQPSRIVNE